MKKLFDETHAHGEGDTRRTIWYQFDETDDLFSFLNGQADEYGCRFLLPCDEKAFAQKVHDVVTAEEKPAQPVSETHWMLYSGRLDEDAIGDRVRFTLLLRQKNNRFDCSVNLSDFVFASAYDMIAKIREATLKRLNG